MTITVNRLHRNSDPVFDLYVQETAKTANYQIVAGDNGTLFTNAGAVGAVTFTLPALAIGPMLFGFMVIADQTVTIASSEGDNIVTPNDASADSLAFQTPGDRVGGYVELFTNAAGTKWYVRKFSPNAVTIAT